MDTKATTGAGSGGSEGSGTRTAVRWTRAREIAAARTRLVWLLALNPETADVEPEASALAFYSALGGDTGRGRLGRRELRRALHALHSILAALLDGRPAPPVPLRGLAATPVTGAPGGVRFCPVAAPADALLVAALYDLQTVGLSALLRCERCGRFGLRRRRDARAQFCSRACSMALSTKRYRAGDRERFRKLQREAYRRRMARKHNRPNIRIGERRRPTLPSPAPPRAVNNPQLARLRGRWVIRWTGADGRREHLDTEARDRATARRRFQAFVDALPSRAEPTPQGGNQR